MWLAVAAGLTQAAASTVSITSGPEIESTLYPVRSDLGPVHKHRLRKSPASDIEARRDPSCAAWSSHLLLAPHRFSFHARFLWPAGIGAALVTLPLTQRAAVVPVVVPEELGLVKEKLVDALLMAL